MEQIANLFESIDEPSQQQQIVSGIEGVREEQSGSFEQEPVHKKRKLEESSSSVCLQETRFGGSMEQEMTLMQSSSVHEAFSAFIPQQISFQQPEADPYNQIIESAVQKLYNTGKYLLGILTNTGYLDNEKTSYFVQRDERFYSIIESCKIRQRKPFPAFFEAFN
uniref:Uncharacterized protein n=1 Tax=Meloidogyne hapla TaxID=6305 RepID=A0A1I8B628_MELHA